jgi:hypothetical protein
VPPSPDYFDYKNTGDESLFLLNNTVSLTPQIQARWLPNGNSDVWATFRIKNFSQDTLVISDYELELFSNQFTYNMNTINLVEESKKNDLLFDSASKSSMGKKPLILPPNKEIKVITVFSTSDKNTREIYQKKWIKEKVKLMIELKNSLVVFNFEAREAG